MTYLSYITKSDAMVNNMERSYFRHITNASIIPEETKMENETKSEVSALPAPLVSLLPNNVVEMPPPVLTLEEIEDYKRWQKKVQKHLPDIAKRTFDLRLKPDNMFPSAEVLEYNLGKTIGIATTSIMPKNTLAVELNRKHVAVFFDNVRITENLLAPKVYQEQQDARLIELGQKFQESFVG